MNGVTGVEGVHQQFELVVGGRGCEHDVNAAVVEGAQERRSLVERVQPRCEFAVEPGVQVSGARDPVVVQLADDGGQQSLRALADRAVDAPGIHMLAQFCKGSLPRVHVQVVGVDEGAVDVEQHS